MTAPDPTPYLLPTDLRTAEDVARWLDTLHKGPPAERIFGVQDAVAALYARLDRERRQACERGAEDCERRLAELGPEPEEPTIDIWGTEALRARLRESALAFRASAVQRAARGEPTAAPLAALRADLAEQLERLAGPHALAEVARLAEDT